jgi:DNA-binding transcriptional regulator GbsR (MarR family)
MSEIEFDPEVFIIEDDVITHFLNSPMFTGRDPLFVRLLILFITRKYLTQNTLQKITGMSAGKISQEVNHLLEMGLIERAETSKKGKITYCASSAGVAFLSITRYTIGKLVNWEESLAKMKKELEDNKKELGQLNGYKRLYRFTEAIVNLISNYKKALDTLDNAIESLKKETQ